MKGLRNLPQFVKGRNISFYHQRTIVLKYKKIYSPVGYEEYRKICDEEEQDDGIWKRGDASPFENGNDAHHGHQQHAQTS